MTSVWLTLHFAHNASVTLQRFVRIFSISYIFASSLLDRF
ncbi:unnamed protein product [Acanthoscelides obtectus]|uniref:Uncharacterized protein n=1 Tax=Acanthoscelides obtectus TaxID=200917 RepID=A0A9P0PC18_ACAOB|nr:unnamed protein product [Acanthoscelides obtectus]CAK1626204.1 hypothetical protein AOBTE_LOCUS3679 [Acanthoscelides obtectus]